MDSENDLENELNSLITLGKARSGDAISDTEFFSEVQRVSKRYSKTLARYFLEACLENGDLSNNPFQSISLKKQDYLYCKWFELACILFNKINDCKEEKKEYIYLPQVIQDYFSPSWRIISNCSYSNNKDFIEGVFNNFAIEFGRAIQKCCQLVYEGLPLYYESDKEEFFQVSNSDGDLIYIFMRGYYRDLELGRYYPDWAIKYYFKSSHIETHKRFFNGYRMNEEAVRGLRTAFRKAIGEKDIFIDHQNENEAILNKSATYDYHKTKLLMIMGKVVERYYGDQFDINNRETWTNQTAVVDWLITEFKLSKREAEAIDMVSRPDIARGK